MRIYAKKFDKNEKMLAAFIKIRLLSLKHPENLHLCGALYMIKNSGIIFDNRGKAAVLRFCLQGAARK